MADKFMVAVGRRTPSSSAHISPRGCVRVLPTWQPVSPVVTDPRERKRKQGGSDEAFYDLTMEVTLPCLIGYTNQSYSEWKGDCPGV